MSQRFLMVWAALATVIAIAMTGYVVGKQAGVRSADVGARPVTDMPYSTESGSVGEPAPAFAVPDGFANAPREWRTQDTDSLGGYVALFDPKAREVIVEQCEHTGYPVDDAGEPGQPTEQQFCATVLSGWLATLTDEEARVQDRSSGSTVAVSIEASLDGDAPTMRLVFDGHDARFVPGSKNDLLQAIEKEPEIVEQKKRYFVALNSGGGVRSDQTDSGDRNDN